MAAATLGAGLGSGLISGLSGLFGQSKQFKEQKKLINLQYEKNLEQWNRENEYNSPVKQMERLKEAGLNANLVYGNGGVTQQAAHSPTYGMADAPNYGPAIQQMVSQTLQTMTALQQIEQSKSQSNLNDQLAVKAAADKTVSDFKAENLKRNNAWIDKLHLSQLKLNDSQIELNGSKVTLNSSFQSQCDATVGMLKSQTKLNDKQLEVLSQNMRESQARIQQIMQNIKESYSRIALNNSNVYLNDARTHGQQIDNYINNESKLYQAQGIASRNLVDMSTWRDVVKTKKFQSASAEEQFKILSAFGYNKASYELLKLRKDLNEFKVGGFDVGNASGSFVSHLRNGTIFSSSNFYDHMGPNSPYKY